jgi:hypothetical protein
MNQQTWITIPDEQNAGYSPTAQAHPMTLPGLPYASAKNQPTHIQTAAFYQDVRHNVLPSPPAVPFGEQIFGNMVRAPSQHVDFDTVAKKDNSNNHNTINNRNLKHNNYNNFNNEYNEYNAITKTIPVRSPQH